MEFSTNEVRIVPLPTNGDVLTEVIRQGAKQLLSQAVEAEVADWIERHQQGAIPRAGNKWFAMASCRRGPSSRALGLWL